MSPEDDTAHTNDTNGINQSFHNGTSQHNNNTSSNNNNFKLPQLSVIKNGSQPANGGREDWKNLKNNYNNNEEEYKDIKEGSTWSDNIALPIINNNGKLNAPNGHSEKVQELDPLTGHRQISQTTPVDPTSYCGLGSFQPKWARSLASTHVFMVVFLFAWVLQGMYFTYFVSVITTIEKLFQIRSRTIGMLLSFAEVGQICTSLFLTYYAGRGHRPRWIACGMMFFAFAAFGSVLPHFIYGDRLYDNSNLFAPIGQFNPATLSPDNSAMINHSIPNTSFQNVSWNLCEAPGSSKQLTDNDKCSEMEINEHNENNQLKYVVLFIFAVSLLGIGIGQTAISTLGIPYIDDNVASKESAIYIAITIGVRILGPAAGFILGSFCTRIYVNLHETTLDPLHTKWIGAWWLGLVLISCCMLIASIAMFTFPKTLRGKRIQPKVMDVEESTKPNTKTEGKKEPTEDGLQIVEAEQAPKFKDFPKTIKRQLKNDILMFRTASCVLHLLPVAGLYTFLPKYLETQFRLTTHEANLISGTGGILVMGFGIIISGFVILKFSPSARSVAAWIAFTALVYSMGMLILSFIGCEMEFNGLQPIASSSSSMREFVPPCNISCFCDLEEYAPVCGSDKRTYFSTCHAGCNSPGKEIDNKMSFNNCTCIGENHPDANEFRLPLSATTGHCNSECQNTKLFVFLFAFFVFMHSTSEVGSMLLIMRCVHPKDKAMAMGVIQFAIGLFGNIPCPIIYGAVVDSACLVWKKICGEEGYCNLYDSNMFRQYFLGTTSAIMGLAFLADLIVWYKANRIDIDPENGVEKSPGSDGGAGLLEKPAVHSKMEEQ